MERVIGSEELLPERMLMAKIWLASPAEFIGRYSNDVLQEELLYSEDQVRSLRQLFASIYYPSWVRNLLPAKYWQGREALAALAGARAAGCLPGASLPA
jgi:hypothetical protein